MKVITILLSAVLVIPSLAACGGDDDDSNGGGASGACAKGCVHAEALNCPNDPADCVADCEQELAGFKMQYPDCGAQFDAAAVCYSNLPASAWSCDADGESAPDMAQCASETAAVLGCL